jgi:hypothetical protein
MKQILFSVFLPVTLILVLFSCQEDEYCTLPLISKVNIGFYSLQDNEMNSKTFQWFSATGLSADSVYYDSLTNSSLISMPLSNSVDTVFFIFTFVELVKDTIELPGKKADYKENYVFRTNLSRFLTTSKEIVDVNADSIVTDTVTSIDTLRFIYTRQLSFISYACGFTNNYSLKELTTSRNRIDSTSIINSFISTTNEENVQILF